MRMLDKAEGKESHRGAGGVDEREMDPARRVWEVLQET